MGDILANNPMASLYVGLALIFLTGLVVGSTAGYLWSHFRRQAATGEAHNAG